MLSPNRPNTPDTNSSTTSSPALTTANFGADRREYLSLSDFECCIGGGDPYISDLVDEARRAGFPVVEQVRSQDTERELSRFRPDGLAIDG